MSLTKEQRSEEIASLLYRIENLKARREGATSEIKECQKRLRVLKRSDATKECL